MIGPSLPPEEQDDDDNETPLDASIPWAISDTLSSQSITRNKRLKPFARLTPWTDRYEVEQVGHSLIAAVRSLPLPNKKGRKRPRDTTDPSLYPTLHRISSWKVRVGNRLSHAVESSYQLTICLARDAHSSEPNRIESIRLAYSSAILRTINGLSDAMQQQKANAQSVAALCADLGIPSWLVDVRHQATHNQMPSLSVLRLAATTLLEYLYQEYWSAPTESTFLLQHLLAYQQQQAKIMARESSNNPRNTSPKKKKKAAKKANKAVKVASMEEDSDDDGESDEEMYLDGTNSALWGPKPGTNTNRFAALMMDNSKSKNKKQKTEDVKPEVKPKPKVKELSPHHHAKQFVKKGMHHLEEAYKTLLLFLVWGDDDSPAAFYPESYIEFPQSQEGVKKLRQRYSVLLSVVGTEWPGFLSGLLIHLVDCILSIENSETTREQATASERKLFFLESWIRHLVSGDFLATVQSVPKEDRSKEPAAWQYLEKMWYPLNSLCDRLQSSSVHGKTSERLANLLAEILGARRVANFGLPHGKSVLSTVVESQPVESARNANDAEAAPSSQKDPSSVDKSTLSLQDIEAMLSNGKSKTDSEEEAMPTDGKGKSEQAEGPATAGSVRRPAELAPRSAWVRCSIWEPSALGALPGHPFA